MTMYTAMYGFSLVARADAPLVQVSCVVVGESLLMNGALWSPQMVDAVYSAMGRRLDAMRLHLLPASDVPSSAELARALFESARDVAADVDQVTVSGFEFVSGSPHVAMYRDGPSATELLRVRLAMRAVSEAEREAEREAEQRDR
jgi:hypothetical protein